MTIIILAMYKYGGIIMAILYLYKSISVSNFVFLLPLSVNKAVYYNYTIDDGSNSYHGKYIKSSIHH